MCAAPQSGYFVGGGYISYCVRIRAFLLLVVLRGQGLCYAMATPHTHLMRTVAASARIPQYALHPVPGCLGTRILPTTHEQYFDRDQLLGVQNNRTSTLRAELGRLNCPASCECDARSTAHTLPHRRRYPRPTYGMPGSSHFEGMNSVRVKRWENSLGRRNIEAKSPL